jgi:anti-anti-sigma regulatory factor
MAITHVILIKDAISQNLTSSKQVLSLFQKVLSSVIVNNVVIDFSGVVFMTSSFAKQYAICKNQSKTKKIREINISNDISIMIKSNIQEIEI